jgi:hypothetical protein
VEGSLASEIFTEPRGRDVARFANVSTGPVLSQAMAYAAAAFAAYSCQVSSLALSAISLMPRITSVPRICGRSNTAAKTPFASVSTAMSLGQRAWSCAWNCFEAMTLLPEATGPTNRFDLSRPAGAGRAALICSAQASSQKLRTRSSKSALAGYTWSRGMIRLPLTLP